MGWLLHALAVVLDILAFLADAIALWDLVGWVRKKLNPDWPV